MAGESVINERIAALRAEMTARGMDAYLIPTADFHGSEYVNDYFQCRRFMTGFTGSAGTAVITREEAGLWTDGRYFVQAAAELSGSEVILFRMREEGVPTVEEYLESVLPEGGCLGFDGRVVSEELGEALSKKLSSKGITFAAGEDLVDGLWSERPPLPREPVWILDEKYSGKSAGEKLALVRKAMRERGADVHILTTLDEIAWLLNLRGNDVPCTPVVLCYFMLSSRAAFLYIQRETLTEEVKDYLRENGVTIRNYDEIYDAVSTLFSRRVLLEKAFVNYRLCRCLPDSATVIDAMNPTALLKAVKNPVEIENMRQVHIKDGVALTHFIYWLKTNVGKKELDEYSAALYLDGLRRQQPGSLGPSFDTISAYGPNAAMCHYKATKEKKRALEPRGLYLVDSGGQYYEGTTDVTRTVALGELTDREKECFTMAACSMLRLLDVKFLRGCRGINLDYVARELFWKRGLDFNHGTGHGVAFVGTVHERPTGIRWRSVAGAGETDVFEAGMITSNEPGFYLEGELGVRTENLMLCVEAEKNEYGQFLKFENLTWVPIDLEALEPSVMEASDVERLNRYHAQVFEKLAPSFEGEELAWLREATRKWEP